MVKHMRKRNLRKKALCLVAPLILFLSMVAPGAFGADTVVKASTNEGSQPGISIATPYLNIRSKASTSGTVVGRLYRGSVCTVTSIEGKWANITSGKIKGYVSTDYIKTGKEAEDLYDTYVDRIAKVNTSKLRVREKASTSSKILGTVSKNTILTVKAVSKKWVKVTYKSKTAYVAKEYVKLSYKFQYAKALESKTASTTSSKTSSNTSLALRLVDYAKQFLGNKYKYGGTSLTKGTDCSGYTQGVFKKFGISLPRTSRQQATVGKKVTSSNLKAGDLVFYGANGTINHVAIYIGNSKVIHASNVKEGIKISKYNYRTIYTARRVL